MVIEFGHSLRAACGIGNFDIALVGVTPVRYLLTIAVLTIPVLVPAAPKLEPRPSFDSVEAEAYGVRIGPREVANTEMAVTFAVRGRKGATYTVDLCVEANSTGEKAEWLRSVTVTLRGGPDDREGSASGEFKVRNRIPHEPPSATHPHLPYARSGLDWAVVLILKDGKQFVTASAPVHAPYNWSKRIHVPD